MKTKAFNTTVLFYPNKNPKLRLFALWYFTALMIIWNAVGHTVLGFEQSWATPLSAIATAVAVSMLLDWIDARAKNRELRFTGGLGNFLNFLPASLIPGFACGMLLYANERLWPVIFAVVLSIGSKLMLRAQWATAIPSMSLIRLTWASAQRSSCFPMSASHLPTISRKM
jgi:hypothetical protein